MAKAHENPERWAKDYVDELNRQEQAAHMNITFSCSPTTLMEKDQQCFYAVATNLDDDPESIIRINHGRWEIEECFRIMKHEFKARPVYLSRDARITAHFTTCFLALILFRYLEKMLGHKYTCEQISNGLRQMKFRKVNDVGYIPAYTRNDFTDALHEAFGFRTDYEILSKAQMRKLISLTKKE